MSPQTEGWNRRSTPTRREKMGTAALNRQRPRNEPCTPASDHVVAGKSAVGSRGSRSKREELPALPPRRSGETTNRRAGTWVGQGARRGFLLGGRSRRARINTRNTRDRRSLTPRSRRSAREAVGRPFLGDREHTEKQNSRE
ncbi:Hypothetical predicted protein [Pelobates cultripes]|uniref:Uncharacterized protein n=1 Tax=Pelobates cultripes TaxID=61616 RepID=A0AAD1SPY4_PELCU|nr:Hypothetical predicted protein [Pelobates cultripes]